MAIEDPKDFLIECTSCGIENVYSEYTAEAVPICNQCRERLIDPNFGDTHHTYRCEACGFTVGLLKATEFDAGNTPCRCGSTKIVPVSAADIANEAAKAGAFEVEKPDDIEASEDYDWFRSGGDGGDKPSDSYNEIFDDDPGSN